MRLSHARGLPPEEQLLSLCRSVQYLQRYNYLKYAEADGRGMCDRVVILKQEHVITSQTFLDNPSFTTSDRNLELLH